MIFTEGVRDAANQTGAVLGEAGVAEALLGRLDLSAEELAASVRAPFGGRLPAPPPPATARSWWSSGNA